MWCGDHPGTGVIIHHTGMHGHLITGTITTDTTHTGTIITTHITDPGGITGAGHITPII